MMFFPDKMAPKCNAVLGDMSVKAWTNYETVHLVFFYIFLTTQWRLALTIEILAIASGWGCPLKVDNSSHFVSSLTELFF